MKKILVLLLVLTTACTPIQGQNRYSQHEAGQATEIAYGTITRVKPVAIQGQSTGLGTSAGMAAGSVAGYQVGNGNGQLGGLIAGMIIGGIVGHLAEQEVHNNQGYEYIIKLDSKRAISVVQNHRDGDKIFSKGDRVMIQTSGSYQRVMEAD